MFIKSMSSLRLQYLCDLLKVGHWLMLLKLLNKGTWGPFFFHCLLITGYIWFKRVICRRIEVLNRCLSLWSPCENEKVCISSLMAFLNSLNTPPLNDELCQSFPLTSKHMATNEMRAGVPKLDGANAPRSQDSLWLKQRVVTLFYSTPSC